MSRPVKLEGPDLPLSVSEELNAYTSVLRPADHSLPSVEFQKVRTSDFGFVHFYNKRD